jgi:hypothetical protein
LNSSFLKHFDRNLSKQQICRRKIREPTSGFLEKPGSNLLPLFFAKVGHWITRWPRSSSSAAQVREAFLRRKVRTDRRGEIGNPQAINISARPRITLPVTRRMVLRMTARSGA